MASLSGTLYTGITGNFLVRVMQHKAGEIEGFKTVRETELARHCSVHNERQPTADYLQQTECRLIGQDGKINAGPEILDKFFIELVTFARALYGHMKVV